MRRRAQASVEPPVELLRFDGDRYFHDPRVWWTEFEAWCAARQEWRERTGCDLPLTADIPDAPFNPESL